MLAWGFGEKCLKSLSLTFLTKLSVPDKSLMLARSAHPSVSYGTWWWLQVHEVTGTHYKSRELEPGFLASPVERPPYIWCAIFHLRSCFLFFCEAIKASVTLLIKYQKLVLRIWFNIILLWTCPVFLAFDGTLNWMMIYSYMNHISRLIFSVHHHYHNLQYMYR